MNKIPNLYLTIPIALLLTVVGVAHLVAPKGFLEIMPDFMPDKLFWVYVSGVAELILAVGLFLPRWRKWAAMLTLAMLLLYLPIHVIDYLRDKPAIGPKPVALLRIPTQFLLMAWTYLLVRRFSK